MGDNHISFSQRVERLENLEKIQQLFVDYARHLDSRNWYELARLFAETGELILEPFGRATGPAVIEALMRARLSSERGLTFHIISNPAVTFDGRRVTAEVNWALITRTSEDTPRLTMLGRHRDVLIEENGTWKFLRREGILDIPTTLPALATVSEATGGSSARA